MIGHARRWLYLDVTDQTNRIVSLIMAVGLNDPHLGFTAALAREQRPLPPAIDGAKGQVAKAVEGCQAPRGHTDFTFYARGSGARWWGTSEQATQQK